MGWLTVVACEVRTEDMTAPIGAHSRAPVYETFEAGADATYDRTNRGAQPCAPFLRTGGMMHLR